MPAEDQATRAKRRVLALFAELAAEGVTVGGHWSGSLVINAHHVDDGGDGSYAEINCTGDDRQLVGNAAEKLAAMGLDAER